MSVGGCSVNQISVGLERLRRLSNLMLGRASTRVLPSTLTFHTAERHTQSRYLINSKYYQDHFPRINETLISTTLVHGNKAKLKRPSLALLRCKMTFEIFELGLIAGHNESLSMILRASGLDFFGIWNPDPEYSG